MKRPQSLKLGASAQTLPILIGYGANLIATPFIVAKLGLTNFGFWALTGALAQYGVLLDLGVSRAIMRYVALYHAQDNKEKERAVVGGCVIIIVLMGCFLILLPIFMPGQLGRIVGIDNAGLSRTLFASSIVVLISGTLGAMLKSASMGRGRMVAGNVGIAIQRSSVVVGGVIAIVVDPTLAAFAIGSAIGGGIGLLFVIFAILIDEREIRIGIPRATEMSEVISFGLKGQVMSVAEIALAQSGKLLAGLLVGPDAAGAYELANRLALGARAFGTSASSVLSVHLTRGFALHGTVGIHRDYARLVQRNAAVSIFPLFFLVATSFSIIPLWLGVIHYDVVWVLIGLTLAFVLNVSTGVTVSAAFALNQLGIVAAIAVGSTILAVTFEWLLGLVFGLNGIVIGMIIATAISAVVGVIVMHRASGIALRQFFKPVSGPILVGGVSAMMALAVGLWTVPANRASAIVPFLGSAAVFCAVYMILGWRLGYLPSVTGLIRRSERQTVAPFDGN